MNASEGLRWVSTANERAYTKLVWEKLRSNAFREQPMTMEAQHCDHSGIHMNEFTLKIGACQRTASLETRCISVDLF